MVTPPFGCSTPAVYRAWDDLGRSHGPTDPTTSSRPPCAVEPRLAEWRDRLGDATGDHAPCSPVRAAPGSCDGSFPDGGHGRPGHAVVVTRFGAARRRPARLAVTMGSLIKKRRKRMRKKKHKKMLKRTRWQRRAAGK